MNKSQTQSNKKEDRVMKSSSSSSRRHGYAVLSLLTVCQDSPRDQTIIQLRKRLSSALTSCPQQGGALRCIVSYSAANELMKAA